MIMTSSVKTPASAQTTPIHKCCQSASAIVVALTLSDLFFKDGAHSGVFEKSAVHLQATNSVGESHQPLLTWVRFNSTVVWLVPLAVSGLDWKVFFSMPTMPNAIGDDCCPALDLGCGLP